jgi:peptidyl-prolyl isomerase D
MESLPPFPADWDKITNEFSINEKMDILNKIKEAGNYFYRIEDYVQSSRKYKKVTRYFNTFKDCTTDPEEIKVMDALQLTSLTNLAATELKLLNYQDVIYSCNAAIKLDPNNTKAFYRRGVANLEMKNYEMAVEDLKMALKMSPNNKAIVKEFERAKKYLLDYRQTEKMSYKNMFK